MCCSNIIIKIKFIYISMYSVIFKMEEHTLWTKRNFSVVQLSEYIFCYAMAKFAKMLEMILNLQQFPLDYKGIYALKWERDVCTFIHMNALVLQLCWHMCMYRNTCVKSPMENLVGILFDILPNNINLFQA